MSIASRPRALAGEQPRQILLRRRAGGAVAAHATPPFSWLIVPLLVVRPALDTLLGLARVSIGPISVTPGLLFNATIVGVALLLVVHALLIEHRALGAVRTAAIIWGPFLIAATASMVRSPVVAEAVQVLFNYLTYASVALIALVYAPYASHRRLTMLVALSAVAPLLTGLFQIATGTTGPRLMACFAHPNILAFFLMIVLSFLYHAQISRYLRSPGARAVIWIIILVSLLELLMTGTRSAFAATMAFLVIYTAVRAPLYLVPMALLAPLALLVPGVMSRIMNAAEGAPDTMSYAYLVRVAQGDVDGSAFTKVDSGTWRHYLWSSAWPWIEHKPVTGYGLSSFPFYSADFFALNAGKQMGAHNVYVQTLFEGGVPLVAGFAFLLASMLLLPLTKSMLIGERLYVMVITISYALICYSDNMLYYLVVNIMMIAVVFTLIGQPFHLSRRLLSHRGASALAGKPG